MADIRDTRYCYGARCMWHGPIAAVATRDGRPGGLPCCPICRGMLFEMGGYGLGDGRSHFYMNAERYDNSNALNGEYVKFVEWTAGKCYPTLKVAVSAYCEVTGRTLILPSPKVD